MAYVHNLSLNTESNYECKFHSTATKEKHQTVMIVHLNSLSVFNVITGKYR